MKIEVIQLLFLYYYETETTQLKSSSFTSKYTSNMLWLKKVLVDIKLQQRFRFH